MNNSTILLGASLFVGAAGGFFVGQNMGDSGDAAASDQIVIQSRGGERVDRDDRSSRFANGTGKASRQGFDEISRLPGSSSRIQAMAEYYQGLTLDQLEEEARKLEELPMNERMMAGMLLFGRWGEVDPYSAMEYSRSMGFAGMFVRPTVLQSWASVDPANAARYYEQNPREFASMGGGRRGGFMRGADGSYIIASEWAKQDPQSALDWANALTGSKRDEAISAVAGEVAKQDPAQAAAMISSMDPSQVGGAYRTIAESYGSKDFAAAQAWIQSLPADEQAGALAAAISGLARTDPRAAATQVAGMTDGKSKDRAVRNVVGAIAYESPQDAAAFLSQNGSVEAQEDSMRELIPAWVSKDPTEALNYSMALPEGEVRDRALSSYVWSNSVEEPAKLVQVAEGISDERARSRMVGWMVARWMREDETAARAYAAESTAISERTKRHVLGEE